METFIQIHQNLTILLAMNALKNIVNINFQIPNDSFDDHTRDAKSGSVLKAAIRATDMLKCINLPNIHIELISIGFFCIFSHGLYPI